MIRRASGEHSRRAEKIHRNDRFGHSIQNEKKRNKREDRK